MIFPYKYFTISSMIYSSVFISNKESSYKEEQISAKYSVLGR